VSDEPTFGARYAAASVDKRLVMDVERREQFATVDRVLQRLISTALSGERIARLDPSSGRRSDEIELLIDLSVEERNAVDAHFDIAAQEKRGSWHVPADEKLSLGLMHLVYWVRKNPRLVLNLAEVDSASPTFGNTPVAVAIWVLEPLFEQLYLPLRLRSGKWLGTKTPDQQEKQWLVADPLYEALGLDLDALKPFRPGQGWSKRTQEEIVAARQALIESWRHAPEDVDRRYRSFRLGQLVERYYSKAKDGKATRKQVLTGPMGRTLTAYFGGDWLGFLAYLGEEPHSDEQVIQALPKTKIVAGTSERTAEVAAAAGVSPEQVQEMLAAYWQQTTSASPIEQRVQAIKRYWKEFDRLHAEQRIGMPSLVSLSQDFGPYVLSLVEGREEELSINEALPADLIGDIHRLWDTAVMPRWPERLITQISPLGAMVQAIGPALRFWEGAALTAWYMSVGPYSRTTLAELADYHERELEALEELGCPIPDQALQELRDAERLFGPEKPAEEEISSEGGFTITMSSGITREGFEPVRDIVTRHRRAWTDEYWDKYVRARWESDLRAVGDEYHRQTAKRGKPPTLKQFAPKAASAANVWFAGNLSSVYAAIGAKSPVDPSPQRLLPDDRRAFAERIFTRLGGKPQKGEYDPEWGDFISLANESLIYVQYWEAMGHPPELKNVGRHRFERRHQVLADDVDEAWLIFGEVIQAEVKAAVAS
jgi:hypothetical protein